MKRIIVFLIIVCAVTSCGRHDRYARELAEANDRQKSGTLFTETEQMRELVEYFDSHGSANEQMLAYYLLGRAHADKGETPMALHCYMDAAARADTTAADCDYRQLSRVYGQMAEIYKMQNLYQDRLQCSVQCEQCACKAHDTLMILACVASKAEIYSVTGQKDSVVPAAEKSYHLCKKHGYIDYGASSLGGCHKTADREVGLEKSKKVYGHL